MCAEPESVRAAFQQRPMLHCLVDLVPGRVGQPVRLLDQPGDLGRSEGPVAQLEDEPGRGIQVMNPGPVRLVDDEAVLDLVDLEPVALTRLILHGATCPSG